jgi:hypothetical protein
MKEKGINIQFEMSKQKRSRTKTSTGKIWERSIEDNVL